MASFVFPKLELPTPKRSNRDLSHTVVGSFSCGPLYPVLALDVLPGDNIKVKLNALIESFPMLAPAMSGYKVSFDAYFCPWSNYYCWMSNDTRLSTEQIIKRKRHTIPIGGLIGARTLSSFSPAMLQAMQVKPGSLASRLGIAPWFFGQVSRDEEETSDSYITTVDSLNVPAERFLAYYDIFRHYYANNQEATYPFYSISPNPSSGDLFDYPTLPVIQRAPLSELDTFFQSVRQLADGTDLSDIITTSSLPGRVYTRSRIVGSVPELVINSKNQGLLFRTYRMDLNRGILSSQVGNYKSTIDTSEGMVSYDTILEAGKLFDLIQRIDVTGGRFSDWMWTRWHVKPYNDIHRPVYLGTVSQTFGNVDVLAPSAGTQYDADGNIVSSSGAGQQTGFAVGRVDRDKYSFQVNSSQYGTLMIIMSMVPLVRYSQGIDYSMLKTTFADIYDPAFQQIGYQDVSRYELSALPKIYVEDNEDLDFSSFGFESALPTQSVGKRVAWSEYMGEVDKAHGDFAQGGSLDYWAFNRVYTDNYNASELRPDTDPAVVELLSKYGSFDMTSYVEPEVWNNLFAVTGNEQDNFRFRVSFDIKAKRPIGNRLLPHS